MTIQANGLYKADTGKIWQNKATLAVGGELLLLGGKDSIDNWQEITQAEYEALKAEQEEAEK